jgi:ABC-type Fe3+ transport system substrate-binding protein
MRRYAFIVLFFIVLVAPFVVQRVVVRGERADDFRATRDAPELVIVTPHNQDIRRTFARAFVDWHRERFGTPLRITYLTPGGTNDIVRMLADTYGAMRDPATGQLPPPQNVTVSIDLVWGGGDTVFDRDLKSVGALQPVRLDPSVLKDAFPTGDLNGVPLYERTKDGSPPRWVGVALSSFGIVYNPQMYDALKLPEPATWNDLARPQLAGLVALADPTRSGSAAVAYMMAIQRGMADEEAAFFAKHPELKGTSTSELEKSNPEYQAALGRGWKKGMRTLLLMAANARYFTDSASQVPNDVGNGDAAAGVAIDFYGRVYQQEIGAARIRYVSPRGATAINPDPIAVLYGVRGEREVLANRFVEFLLTPQAQRLWNVQPGYDPHVARSLRRLPIRRDVYRDKTGWADPEANPFEESGGFNMRLDWMRLFSDTRPVWAAAWIDSRAALKEAYERILEVNDIARRDQLLFELSDLPIEMQHLVEQSVTRKQLEESKQDARLWMTKQRVHWADAFREHYRRVAAKARV